MGACPERIISFTNYSVDMVGSMIKAIKVPRRTIRRKAARILGLICENDAYPALDIAALEPACPWNAVRALHPGALPRVGQHRSGSPTRSPQGIDGVLLIGCKHGDDYQCHFIKGSELAEIRVKKIGEALSSLALELERVAQFQIAIDEYDKVPQVIQEFVGIIEGLGPNPFKGF